MVNVVTSNHDIDKLSPLTDLLLEKFPEITSLVNNVNTRKADVAFGEYETLLYGEPFIREKLGELTFEISANSFFQTNTKQGEVLYNEVSKLIGLTGEEIVYDLYCGTGTIGLFIAEKAKKNERINISVLAWLIEYFFQGQMFTTEPITNPSIIENVEFLCLKKSLLRILLSKSKPIIAPIKNVDII